MKITTTNLVYLGLLLYIFSCFLGSTPITVCSIIASVFLFFDIFKRLSKKEEIKLCFFQEGLSFFTWSLTALVLAPFIVRFVHAYDFSFLASLSSLYKGYFLFFLVTYVICNFDYQKDFQLVDLKRVFILAIVTGSLVTSFYIILQFVGLIALNHKGYFGIISQPFTSCGLLLAGIFSSLYFHRLKTFKKRVFLPAVLIQIFALILLSQVSAWFGFLFGFLVINFKQRIISFKILTLLLVVSISALFLATQYVPRMKRKVSWFTSFEKLTTNKSIQCRKELWQSNLNGFSEFWLFGRKKLIENECTIREKTSILPHAHNIYLQQLFMGGVFKLLIWLVFYLGLFFFLIKTYSENQVFLGYFIALSTEGIFEYWWGDSEVKNIFLAIMFCLIVITNYQSKIRRS